MHKAEPSLCLHFPVAIAMDGALPPPPPTPPLLEPLPSAVGPPNSSSSSSLGPTLLIIIVILASIFVAALLLRFFLRLFPSSSTVSPAIILAGSDSAAAAAASDSSSAAVAEEKKSALIESLPLFKLGSPLAALSKSSPDCAVCLRTFRPNEDLHLLPSCCHAFHSDCLKTWIQSSASCPLCRALVTFPLPPLPPAPPPSSGMFAVEVDRRASAEEGGRNLSLPPPMASPPRRLTYSIGSSFDCPFEEEDVESALSGIQRRSDTGKAVSRDLSPPREQVAAAAGGGSRRWLRDCVDRIVSSRSSSSRSASFRFSDRWIYHHEDNGHGGGREQYFEDWEGNARRDETEHEWLYTVYRWIMGP